MTPHRQGAMDAGQRALTAVALELSPEEAEKRLAAFLGNFPLGRIGTARDIANATLILASDVTSYVTGQVFHVSGGSVI